ncbi:MAG: hypothetical protein ACOC44_15715 [Promethearchaeia archaeon]
MYFKRLNNADMWNKIQKLRVQIKKTPHFKDRSCWLCGKSLNIYDFLSDNMEYSAAQILNLWQNSMLEFHCCECFKDLKRDELEKIEQVRESRACNNCRKEFDIYHFSKEYKSLKIKEIETLWLDPEKLIFCSRFCEKKYFKTRRRENQE